MKRLGVAAYALGVACAIVFSAPTAVDTISYHADLAHNADLLWPLWLVATTGPLLISIIMWVIAEKSGSRWLPHLVFIPIAIIFYRESMSLFLNSSGLMIHDGPAGDASMLGMMCLLLALLVHVIALVVATRTGRQRLANVR